MVVRIQTRFSGAGARLFTGLRVIILFTYSDVKTILLPISAFACVTGPVSSLHNGILAVLWIWLHLLQCNISNQCNSALEDLLNHPQRPIPSGLITETQSRFLRWALAILCLCLSGLLGLKTFSSSFLMTTTMIFYDDFHLAGHWSTKNLCTFAGYLCFEVGATLIMSRVKELDDVAIRALACSGFIILSTIHAQDFPDVEGDRALNRATIPIVAPNASRPITALVIILWSLYSSSIWGLGIWSSLVLSSVGLIVAWRIYFLRLAVQDRTTYRVYNAWLMMLHLLPANARWDTLKL
ncbi:UbiA prenyltransferase family [Rhodocollybia butyracea]|uniref:UbiA prenyltransferase family n=1 Tax=Rhodocollybia butyracea TaxID=206335 RepID=A0A9P5P903_9AGAR|nr:UbiA prenyltransferase family [Rhodocollybia butyracea]